MRLKRLRFALPELRAGLKVMGLSGGKAGGDFKSPSSVPASGVPGDGAWFCRAYYLMAITSVIFAVQSPARACPLCKDSAPVSDSRPGDPVADTAGLNFNPSIYGLLGGVSAAAGVAGFAMVKASRGI